MFLKIPVENPQRSANHYFKILASDAFEFSKELSMD